MSDAPATAAELGRAIERVRSDIASVRTEIGRVVVGLSSVVDDLMVALLADGHVLLEGPPGLGKTLLVRSLASALDLSFRRVQCTPDLMPGDITGSSVMLPGPNGPVFSFAKGPVFTQVLLVDEVNRATPKTQAALLEAMEERNVTAGGETRPLPDPFLVLATQNPIEMEGTYPLPEAQLDRFLLKLLLPSPDAGDIAEIVRRTTAPEVASASAVLDAQGLSAARRLVRQVPLPTPLLDALARTVAATHPGHADAPAAVRRFVRFGVSPRGARALALSAKARALVDGRPNVSEEDLLRGLLPALRHRLILSFEAEAEGISADDVLADVARLLAA